MTATEGDTAGEIARGGVPPTRKPGCGCRDTRMAPLDPMFLADNCHHSRNGFTMRQMGGIRHCGIPYLGRKPAGPDPDLAVVGHRTGKMWTACLGTAGPVETEDLVQDRGLAHCLRRRFDPERIARAAQMLFDRRHVPVE